MSLHANNVANAVSGTPGTGTITLGSAVSGAQSFASAYGANATVDVFITDGTAWEVARNCTYTHSGTTLSRGTLEASSTGSAISLTSAAVVRVAATADFGNRLDRALQAVTPGGRLTTESGVPVSTSDRTAQSTLYYTPYIHNVISLWNGSEWVPITFTEHTVTGAALSGLTSGKNYDVFAYLSGGALATELLVWTNDTTRATAVTVEDGRYCKSGDKTRLLIGTIRTTGTTTTEDSGGGSTSQVGGKRFVSNVYNRVQRQMIVRDATDSWSYTTDTIRQANNAAGNKVEYVAALNDHVVDVSVHATVFLSASGSVAAKAGVGVDSTSAFSGLVQGGYINSASLLYAPVSGKYLGLPGVGYHYLAWCEKGGGGTSTFLGDNGGDSQQSGMAAEIFA